ncbi:MAG: hypothetical protein EAZ47_01465 [Bacteroidetes bacterium]|nr:MAG: hypothetical protein EAY72_11125 [Bacteroidota bacterium]TAE63615.1 MAG: hypothetical protein EAY68_07750 [Bacteroidota bacterium]TAF97756.1 MAG: hypothetical protein EAZ47_01465 [Bacteroidota bacterium]
MPYPLAHNIVFSRIILACTVLAIVSTLGILAFYNHAHTDDYIALYDVAKKGSYPAYFEHIYHSWGGRYTSITLAWLFAKNSFLLHHYWLHTWLLIAAQIGANYYLIRSVTIHYFSRRYPWWQKLLIATTVFCVQYSCLPEVGTAFYWFSSSITYQTGMILFMLALTFTIAIFNERIGILKWVYTLLLSSTIIALVGSSETAAMIAGVVYLAMYFMVRDRANELMSVIAFISVIYIGSLAITYLAPGNSVRSEGLPRASVGQTIAFATARTAYTFWHLFKTPSFWLLAALIPSASWPLKERLKDRKWLHLLNSKKISGVVYCVGSIWLAYIPLCYFGNGSFPERATNLMVQFSLLNSVAYLTIISFSISNIHIKNVFKNPLYVNMMVLGLAITFICNHNSGLLVRTAVVAPTQHRVLAKREQQLTLQGKLQVAEAFFPAFGTALAGYLQTQPPVRSTFKDWMLHPSPLLFLYDDMNTEYSRQVLARYYGIAEIKVLP